MYYSSRNGQPKLLLHDEFWLWREQLDKALANALRSAGEQKDKTITQVVPGRTDVTPLDSLQAKLLGITTAMLDDTEKQAKAAIKEEHDRWGKDATHISKRRSFDSCRLKDGGQLYWNDGVFEVERKFTKQLQYTIEEALTYAFAPNGGYDLLYTQHGSGAYYYNAGGFGLPDQGIQGKLVGAVMNHAAEKSVSYLAVTALRSTFPWLFYAEREGGR